MLDNEKLLINRSGHYNTHRIKNQDNRKITKILKRKTDFCTCQMQIACQIFTSVKKNSLLSLSPPQIITSLSCFCREPKSPNRRSQIRHLYGRWPVCRSMCRRSSMFITHAYPHRLEWEATFRGFD